MTHLLEEWIELKLDKSILLKYWDTLTDHADFRAIIDAMDKGGGQTCDIPGILKELDKAGFIIRKSNISNELDKAITDELNNPPKDISKC